MREVLEHEPEPPARGRRALVVLAGLGIAAVVIARLVAMHDEPVADPPAPPASEETPADVSRPGVGIWGQPIANAPIAVRMIELVSASRGALFTGSLDGGDGQTTPTGEMPYATDSVAVHEYGAGVVVGPAPGAGAPGVIQVLGVDVSAPTELVDGIVPAVGGGYWIMDTAKTASGACQMHLMMLSGNRSDLAVAYPCSFVPEHETAAGFVGRVGSRLDPSSGTLLDRTTGALTPIGGALLAAADRYLVRWSEELFDPLVVEDVVSGETNDIVLPPGRATRQVALSPEGRYLAVVLTEQFVGVRSYEVWVHDVADGRSQMATVTTLDGSALELAWRGDVLVVVGNGIEAYDAEGGRLYRSTLKPMPARLDAVAMPFAVQ